ncbi:hypothetical protein PCC6912_34450 [Chlorogloeopsis fritschii PCC 6912]|uniref:CRISPR-associated protein n=1 Tax=Chlorogloeopsis fritschii PCC 6912 TaxID=211165 RepID=A0A433NA25_CHLFR|nr:hypothetical protein [Chlorogloeopsis fritschii]RUR78680.1 hypothetical protein PCC6912_34450 [Chlorogloeopsis fritschii PCC 6912]
MLAPKQNQNSPLENIFSPRSPLDFLGFAVVGVIINLLSGADPLGFLGVGVLFIYWLWLDRRRVKKLSQRLRFVVDKEPPKGAKGLILLLSPYSPRQESLRDEKQLKPLVEHIINTPIEKLQLADFQNIDLFNSNLFPQIKAVEYHIEKGNLRDVWLISSQSYDQVKGSEITAQILLHYLSFQYGQRLEVHSQGFCVEDWNYKKLWDLADKIFRESDYKDEAVVADITGGTKMMTMALAMACIPPKRRMQYMDAQRDWQGNPLPVGEINPIGIEVAPIIHGNE